MYTRAMSPSDNLAGPVAAGTLRGLPDELVLDLLEDIRRRVAGVPAESVPAYEGALAALEAEAARRELTLPGERERMPVAVARRRLARLLRSGRPEELLELVPDLDPRGLYGLFRRAAGRHEPEDRLRLLEAIFVRLDELHYDPAVAHRRRERFLRPELPLTRRLERIRKAVAFQFRTLHRLG